MSDPTLVSEEYARIRLKCLKIAEKIVTKRVRLGIVPYTDAETEMLRIAEEFESWITS